SSSPRATRAGLGGAGLDRLVGVAVPAELLVPPDRLAALQLRLGLADESGKLGFLLRQVRLQLGDGCLAVLDLVGAENDVGAEGHVALGVGDLRLEPVELRLSGGKLGLAPVELGRAGDCVANGGGLVRILAFERLELAAQSLLLEQQLRLALAEGLVLRRDA